MSDPVIDDADPSDVAGLRAAVIAERKLRQAAQAERDRLAVEYESHKTTAATQLAELQGKAKSWDDHRAAAERARDEANAARLAALSEATRATITALGLDGEKLSGLLAAMPAPAADPAPAPAVPPPATPEPVKAPVIPAGGQVPTPAPSADLAPEIRAWVETRRRDLIGVGKAAVEAAYKSFGPGASPPQK